MCLHLVWTNTRQFLAGPEQYFSFLPAGFLIPFPPSSILLRFSRGPPVPPKQTWSYHIHYLNLLPCRHVLEFEIHIIYNEEICLQVISQSETNCLSFPIKNLARLPFSRKLRLSSTSKKIEVVFHFQEN